ncbi:MAG: hypothetical protein JXK07_16120 [Spirochaetes bacterium]|nr:hypothetical protein [Spirochaetota bacterium]MBN2771992.1 hypothetical protein [Spirochaetota bacterium]
MKKNYFICPAHALICIIFLFFITGIYSREAAKLSKGENMNIETVIQKGKEHIIKTALSIYEDKYKDMPINLSLYSITIWRNSTEIKVVFTRDVTCRPLHKKNDNLYYDIVIEIFGEKVSPFDMFGTDKFFIASKEESAIIDTIKKKMKMPLPFCKNSIYETEEWYVASITSRHSFGKFFFDKKTLEEIKDMKIEGSYAQMTRPDTPEDPDPWVELFKDK